MSPCLSQRAGLQGGITCFPQGPSSQLCGTAVWLLGASPLPGPLPPVGFKILSSSVVLKHKGLEASEEASGHRQKVLEAGSGRRGWQDGVELSLADLIPG